MSGETMKAIRIHAFGGPEVLRYEDAPKLSRSRVRSLFACTLSASILPTGTCAMAIRRFRRNGGRKCRSRSFWARMSQVSSKRSPTMSEVSPSATRSTPWFDFSVSGKAGPTPSMSACLGVGSCPQACLSIDHVHAAGAPMSLLTAWQFMIELGHNEPNPLQPHRHQPVPLKGKTVLVNGAAKRRRAFRAADRQTERR